MAIGIPISAICLFGAYFAFYSHLPESKKTHEHPAERSLHEFLTKEAIAHHPTWEDLVLDGAEKASNNGKTLEVIAKDRNGSSIIAYAGYKNPTTFSPNELLSVALYERFLSESNASFILRNKANDPWHNARLRTMARLGLDAAKAVECPIKLFESGGMKFACTVVDPAMAKKLEIAKPHRERIATAYIAELLFEAKVLLEQGADKRVFLLLMEARNNGYTGIELFLNLYKAYIQAGEILEAKRVAEYILKQHRHSLTFDKCLEMAQVCSSKKLVDEEKHWMDAAEATIQKGLNLEMLLPKEN